MVKYIVVCGPVLRPYDSEILNIMDTYNVSGRFEKFVTPEAYYGPSQVREFVVERVSRQIPTIFVTRYPHTLEELCGLIDNEFIEPSEVLIVLLRYDEYNNLRVTEHTYTKTGLTNEWPFGILS